VIVCHCEQVSDRTISHAIAAGARTVDDVTDACRAGGNCGGCTEAIEQLLLEIDRSASRGRVPRWRRHLVPQHA
jgi:bacterioferritin-associated ferredoxin